MLRTFDLATIPGTPWKNGGGITQEVICWPEGSDLTRFEWRVSVASIAASGPFSRFDGVDRVIVLLEGAGVRLRSRDGHIDYSLTTPCEPFAFPGEAEIDCTLEGSASRDFNVMTRRDAMTATVSILRTRAALPTSEHGLLYAPFGAWSCDDGVQRTLAAGRGVWWANEMHRFMVSPIIEQAAPLIAVQFYLGRSSSDRRRRFSSRYAS